MGFKWEGRDGIIYDLETAKDSHLRFAHRLWREKLLELEKNIILLEKSGTLLPSLAREKQILATAVVRRAEAIQEFKLEIEKRGLVPLPLRSEQERQAVRQKRKEYLGYLKQDQQTENTPVFRITPRPNQDARPTPIASTRTEDRSPPKPKVSRVIRLPQKKGDP